MRGHLARAGQGGIVSPDPRTNLTAARAALLMAQNVEDAVEAELPSHLVLPQFFFAFPPGRPPVFEAHVPHYQWEAAETAMGDYRAWPIELFARCPDQPWPVHPLDGSTDPWADGRAATDQDEFDGWIRRQGQVYPQAGPAPRGHLVGPQLGAKVGGSFLIRGEGQTRMG